MFMGQKIMFVATWQMVREQALMKRQTVSPSSVLGSAGNSCLRERVVRGSTAQILYMLHTSGLGIRLHNPVSVASTPQDGNMLSMFRVLASNCSERISEKFSCNSWLIQRRGGGRREERETMPKNENSF